MLSTIRRATTVAARVVVAEREAERDGSATRRQRAAAIAAHRRRRAERSAAIGATAARSSGRRYNHPFILWARFVEPDPRARRWRSAGPGLFLVAFLDSSFLPLPGITDVLLIVHGDAHSPRRCCSTSSMTVAGSVAGCLVLHYLGRKGGEALVRKRFTGEKIERAMAALQRYGVMAVLVPSPAAAAGAVQDFRPARRRRRHQRRPVRDGDRDRPRRALPRARPCWRSGTASGRWRTCASTARAVSLVAVGVLAAGFAAYLLWSKARPRARDKAYTAFGSAS